jgi:uncharacterized RDD family membrane protein YckC
VSGEQDGWWCPACRDQYIPGRVRCAECGAELVPSLEVLSVAEARGHELHTLDGSGWSEDEWAGLRLLLESSDIVTAREGETLVFPAARAAEVDALVASVVGGRGGVAPSSSPGDGSRSTPPSLVFGTRVAGGEVVAGGLRRLAGWFVDLLLATALFGLLHQLVGSPVLAGRLALVAVAAAHVAMIRTYGQTPGKTLVRTRVVDVDTGELPSWRAAVIRWAVPTAGSLLAYVPVPVALAGPLLQVIVYGGVLFPPRRRGLHDLAAGTVVVLRQAR